MKTFLILSQNNILVSNELKDLIRSKIKGFWPDFLGIWISVLWDYNNDDDDDNNNNNKNNDNNNNNNNNDNIIIMMIVIIIIIIIIIIIL